MYHGRAMTQKAAIASGWARRRMARQWLVASAQMPTAPVARITAAGPFASTPRARAAPNKQEGHRSWRGAPADFSRLPRSAPAWRKAQAALAIAIVRQALKSMSGVAARAKPTAA